MLTEKSLRSEFGPKRKSQARDLDYDRWLERRQVEERHRSLLHRLERLAQDAQIERLDNAAALLRDTAEAFRIALREKHGGGR